MADYHVYDSEQELREALGDLQDMLKDCQQTQQALDEQRGVLIDQVQGAQAVFEKCVSDYEQRRDALDQRQALLSEQIKECLENRDALQQQLDAKRDAKLGHSGSQDAPVSPSSKDQQQTAKPGAGEGDNGPVTKAGVEELKSQLARPQAKLEPKPPGQASTVDQELKRMASEIKRQEKRLDNASIDQKANWDKSNGPKP